MRIEVHIERLVVDSGLGLDARHAAELRAAVVAELTRALAVRSEWAPLMARTVSAGPLRLPSPVAPGPAGQAIAEGLSTALTTARARR